MVVKHRSCCFLKNLINAKCATFVHGFQKLTFDTFKLKIVWIKVKRLGKNTPSVTTIF